MFLWKVSSFCNRQTAPGCKHEIYRSEASRCKAAKLQDPTEFIIACHGIGWEVGQSPTAKVQIYININWYIQLHILHMYPGADLQYLQGFTGLNPVRPHIWQTILVGLTNFQFGQVAVACSSRKRVFSGRQVTWIVVSLLCLFWSSFTFTSEWRSRCHICYEALKNRHFATM